MMIPCRKSIAPEYVIGGHFSVKSDIVSGRMIGGRGIGDKGEDILTYVQGQPAQPTIESSQLVNDQRPLRARTRPAWMADYEFKGGIVGNISYSLHSCPGTVLHSINSNSFSTICATGTPLDIIDSTMNDGPRSEIMRSIKFL
ncbi:hypothetical protein SADUNF_Sadunf11G0014700 [Salix dunnii]|uniref:Uncharacterized protein n=1 Tax=Salix dunnii TaxID=1413687 RepID=A0A835MWJ7_9ROSI|nr:hypothetical protein SADUNF_Sadunf11G0014700 [Salix dunnii]